MDIEKLKIEAAKNTWTGKQALKYNFTEVEFDNKKTRFNEKTKLYEQVRVRFSKKKKVGKKE